MSLSISAHDPIAQARQLSRTPGRFPWRSFAEWFAARVDDPRRTDQAFLIYYDDDRAVRRAWTYGEFGMRVRGLAAFLKGELGLVPGDRIATLLFNHDETVVLYFAAWLARLIVVPINREESIEKKRYILEHSEAKAAFCCADTFAEVRTLQPGLPALRSVLPVGEPAGPPATGMSNGGHATGSDCGSLEEEALIVYTSGTTGPPKGVVLSVSNLLADAEAIAEWHRFGPTDRLMCVLPIHHVNGTVVTLVAPFSFGGSVVLNRKFKARAFWHRIHEEGVTCVSVVPTLLEFLLDANEGIDRYDLGRFKGLICGAGPLLVETATRFEDRFGIRILHGYGLSETTCYSSFLPDDLSAAEHRHWLSDFGCPSIGVPIAHNEMAILDDHGRPVAPLVRGEICIRGRTVCAGYFKRPDANEAAFQWGWLRSGDEGFYVPDQRGRPFFFISGRIKELIIRGGVNVSPLEIDDVLRRHPAVQFAMAVAFENRYYGEEIAAYVVARDGERPSEDELLRHCRQTLPFGKCPKVVVFGQDVPFTSTGKPKRLELKGGLAPALARYRDTQFREWDDPSSHSQGKRQK